MQIYTNPLIKEWAALCQRPQLKSAVLEDAVLNILNKISTGGDQALKDITLQFDHVEIRELQVSDAELLEAKNLLSGKLQSAIQQAAANIRAFHSAQLRDERKIETTTGVVCWRKAVPIQKIGLYVPGGSAPLFSTVLMLGIPATLACCPEIILCTPPNSDGKIHPAILYSAQVAGITKIFKVGGAQAIAAMAYGTESIPQVYKIFGPGNQYVTKAKELVNRNGIAIDFPAGPSEVLILADESANPSYVAADLLSQAEHGKDSQVILIVTSGSILSKIQRELREQLQTLPRKVIAEGALSNSRTILFDQTDSAINFINEYAPEHLIINTIDADSISEKIVNAGSIFLGQYSPEAAGDYASGTNHTLPTNGNAKKYGGVALESFVKFITFQKISQQGIKDLGATIEEMAAAENLEAHKRAITIRINGIENDY